MQIAEKKLLCSCPAQQWRCPTTNLVVTFKLGTAIVNLKYLDVVICIFILPSLSPISQSEHKPSGMTFKEDSQTESLLSLAKILFMKQTTLYPIRNNNMLNLCFTNNVELSRSMEILNINEPAKQSLWFRLQLWEIIFKFTSILSKNNNSKEKTREKIDGRMYFIHYARNNPFYWIV